MSLPSVRISVCVTAHNEERNVRRLLRSVLGQNLGPYALSEVVVVASGCTDDTIPEVEDVARIDPRVRLVVQTVRMGKSAAINAYGRERDRIAEVGAIISADVVLQPGCLLLLTQRLLSDEKTGMVGGHPTPTNPQGTMMGDIVNFLWQMHHDIAMQSPKLGEVVMFRSALLQPIPEECPVDEARVEASVLAQGYELAYVPQAYVANRGPDNLREYFCQRRRIAAGHFWLHKTTGYVVPTFEVKRVVRRALRYLTFSDPRTDANYVTAALIEGVARAFGYFDFKREFNHAVWKVAPSTRDVLPQESARKLKMAGGNGEA